MKDTPIWKTITVNGPRRVVTRRSWYGWTFDPEIVVLRFWTGSCWYEVDPERGLHHPDPRLDGWAQHLEDKAWADDGYDPMLGLEAAWNFAQTWMLAIGLRRPPRPWRPRPNKARRRHRSAVAERLRTPTTPRPGTDSDVPPTQ
jgi:hypothetical protein